MVCFDFVELKSFHQRDAVFNIRVCFDLFGPDENLEFITKKKFLNSTGSETRPLNTLKYANSGLHNSCHPTIRDGSTWSKFGARGEHGDVFLFSNLGALSVVSIVGKLTFVDVYLKIFISCLFKGSQEQSFFLQTLLFTAFLVTVLKMLTYALVST